MNTPRRFATLFVCVLAVLLVVPAQAQSDEVVDKELFWAKTLLADVGLRADSGGIRLVRRRFERLLDDERVAHLAHYYIGFANWQLSSLVDESEEMIRLIDDGIAHLKKAMEQDPSFADAYALAVVASFPLYWLDQSRAMTLRAELNAWLAKALELEPDNPRVIAIEALNLFYTPDQFGGSVERGMQRFHEALRRFEQQPSREDGYPDWGYTSTLAWLGQAYLFHPESDPLKARTLFEKALSLRPDYDNVKNRLLPFTDPISMLPPSRFQHIAWTHLATDEQGDGTNPDLADGKALHYYYDAHTDSLWFKFDLHSLPDPTKFGLNLIVDTDQDASTGANWWGTNTTFSYDKLVTVWVVSPDGDSYMGVVGIADAKNARRGTYTKLSQNNITLSVDADHQVLIVGLKRSDLDEDKAMHLIAAVGSNRRWNDDLSASGHVVLDLDKAQ